MCQNLSVWYWNCKLRSIWNGIQLLLSCCNCYSTSSIVRQWGSVLVDACLLSRHLITPSNSDYGLSETLLQAPQKWNQPQHTSFRWVKIKFHAEIQLSKLPGIALNIWLEWWWSNSLLCHSQLELRLSWAMTNWGKDEGWKGRGEPCCWFLHISSS